ncbi:MAG: cytochrome c3 family protein [Chloroflexi bacterium]|nr:cytochrome c3 family protein [Chloroflexota bacterium]
MKYFNRGASMIKKLFDALNQPLGRIGVLITLLVVFSAAVWGIAQTQKPPEQPIQFPHNLHVGVGIQCLYCHSGALRGASPGLPTETKCWGCHQQMAITKTSPLLKPLVQAVENNQPINWIPVAQVPDFVRFVHRPHIAAGLNCEVCHGNVSQMTVYQNPQVLNMGWCLACHRAKTEDNTQNNPGRDPAITAALATKRTKLTDCSLCHY